MDEIWWAVESPDGYEEFFIVQDDAAECAAKYARFYGLGFVKIAEVSVRPLEQKPCEWEKSPSAYGTTTDYCKFQCYEFCPMCGRSLK